MSRPSDLPAEEVTASPPASAGGEGGTLLRGGSWLAAGQLLRNVLQIVVIVILAKLLSPADYGLATLAFIVIGFGYIFTELGLTAAVVQKQDLTEDDLRAAFWLNAGAGLVVTAVVATAAPSIAAVYDEPRLLPLLLVSSLTFTVSLGIVHTALLERAGRFRTLTVIDLACTVFGWTVTVVAAASGLGALSLVLGPLLQAVLSSVVLWCTVRWLPRGRGSRMAYAHVWRFGRALSGYTVVNFLSFNADSIVVSRVAGTSELGLYNRAYNLTRMPADQAFWILDRLLLPTFSRLQTDRARLQAAVLRSVGFSCLLLFPALFGMAVLAEPIVGGVLGDKWLGMVPLLQLLAIASAPQVAVSVMRTVFTAAGATGKLFRYGLVQNAVTVAAILVGARWGPIGVAAALALRAWLGLPWLMAAPMRLLDLTWSAAVAPMVRVLTATLVMSGAVHLLDDGLADQPPAVRVSLGILLGVTVFGLSAALVARTDIRSAIAFLRRRTSQ